MTSWRAPVEITVPSWFHDHRFNGRAVLPAVESMGLLAAAVLDRHPEIEARVMEEVRFAKFLEIPAGSTRLTALIEGEQCENGAIRARLMSRVQFKAMARLQEHGGVRFAPAGTDQLTARRHDPAPPRGPVAQVSAAEVYRELVPFGPTYHSLQETLWLSGARAWGTVQAPDLQADWGCREITGSPFPLDGAMHAACVLGQRFADFVPFPVGLARRQILQPTQAGGRYRVSVELISSAMDELVFDLQIFDDQGEVFEAVTGVRMRDVSGGRVRPPAWIKNRATNTLRTVKSSCCA